MAEKTYNAGRVVGWSAYEEFIRQTGTDPTVISSYIYQTLVTYGVSRRIELLSGNWTPSNGGQFYTQTIEVAGASWGAVPIIGLDYEAYMEVFASPSTTTESDEIDDTFEKDTLEQSVANIFAVYVSDELGNKAQSPLSSHGYLTFVAYPDVVNFMQGMPGKKLKLIVRGLSMENLGDVNNLYFGPQGLMFAGNGMVEDCSHSTENMNKLSLNSAGYLWMSVGGACTPADYRGLVNHPVGSILTSTFGYIDPDMLNGEGRFSGSTYALTYKEYVDGLYRIETLHTQVDAIPVDERDDYVYLVSGRPSYTDYPAPGTPLFILPVRKDTGKINVGAIADWKVPKMKKLIDFTRSYGSDDTTVLYLYNKKLPDYMGNWWTHLPMRDPMTAGLTYVGNGPLSNSEYWLNTDLTEEGAFHNSGRQASWKFTDKTLNKGAVYVVCGQSDASTNGLFLCTVDAAHEDVGYSMLNRIGGYISGSVPDWVKQLPLNTSVYQVDLTDHTTTISNGILYVDGCPIYPGEPLELGDVGEQWVVYVENTISSNQAKLIVRNISNVYPTLTLDSTASADITDESDTHSNIIHIPRTVWNANYADRVLTVNTDATTTESFTTTNNLATAGSYVQVTHAKEGVYGYDKTYVYTILSINATYAVLASAMVFNENPDLLSTVGVAGEHDCIIPRYNQQLPNAAGNYYYNVGAALNKVTARQFFEDFGWDINDYVDADFQNLSLGQFLRECVVRNDLSVPKSPDTSRGYGMNVTFNLYTKEMLGIQPLPEPDPETGQVYCRMPQPSPEIHSTLTMNAKTKPTSFFDTAFYTVTDNNGIAIDINNADYPIWVTLGKSRFGPQVMSESLIDSDGSRLDFSGNGGSIEADKITWLDLLIALGTGKNLDILKGLTVRKVGDNQSCIVGADGTKLVLSTTEPDPADFEVGTYGLGW